MIRTLFRSVNIAAIIVTIVILLMNLYGSYILRTGVDPYNPLHTWILRYAPQIFPW